MKEKPRRNGKLKRFFKILGPGLVTGASDDDPSGIATYSQSGAQFGTGLLWSAILTLPLMIAIQEMAAKIGLVTEMGLTAVIKKYYSRTLLYFILFVSMPSITINIGADIAGMGAVCHLMIPSIPAFVFALMLTAALMYAVIAWSYDRIARVLKFLCITLFSYLLLPFFTHTNWPQVLKDTFIPPISFSSEYLVTLIGILGTTISPYLFFWQASMEQEEVTKRSLIIDRKAIREMQYDTRIGMVLSNLVFYFIVLTTGTVLYKHGVHQVHTVQNAAEALRPLAGEYAYLLFSLGIIGTAALSIPVLAGSLSYMMAETFDWKEGLNKKFHQAPGFYITMLLSVGVSLFVLFTDGNPMKILFYTAILYGITAPIIIGLILHICNNKKIMGDKVNNWKANTLGIITFILMTLCTILLVYLQITE